MTDTDTAQDPQDPQDDLLMALSALKRAMVLTTVGIDPGSFQVLHQLTVCGRVRQGALAEQLGLDASTVSRHVRALVRDDLVAVTRDPDDGRATVLSVTEPGRDLIARRRAAHRARLSAATRSFTPAERADLVRLLKKLAASLGDLEELE